MPPAHPAPPPDLTTPAAVIAYANDKARQAPALDQYLNAVQQWTYKTGKLYQIYTLPKRITALLLSDDEQLVSFLAGDAREEYWLFQRSTFGPEGAIRDVLAVSPQEFGMINNLVILTTQRTYAIELVSPTRPRRGTKHENSYMVQVEWTYPEVEARTRAKAAAEATLSAADKKAEQLDLSTMHFVYDISTKTKPRPRWMPLSAFHDGSKAYIRFPHDLATTEAPVLYVNAGKHERQIVNYRKKGSLYIVDRLFEAAELRVGGKKAQVVQIRLREDRIYESQHVAVQPEGTVSEQIHHTPLEEIR